MMVIILIRCSVINPHQKYYIDCLWFCCKYTHSKPSHLIYIWRIQWGREWVKWSEKQMNLDLGDDSVSAGGVRSINLDWALHAPPSRWRPSCLFPHASYFGPSHISHPRVNSPPQPFSSWSWALCRTVTIINPAAPCGIADGPECEHNEKERWPP